MTMLKLLKGVENGFSTSNARQKPSSHAESLQLAAKCRSVEEIPTRVSLRNASTFQHLSANPEKPP
jgi:hypothetical protein